MRLLTLGIGDHNGGRIRRHFYPALPPLSRFQFPHSLSLSPRFCDRIWAIRIALICLICACCHPLASELALGFAIQHHIITHHRQSCSPTLRLPGRDSDSKVEKISYLRMLVYMILAVSLHTALPLFHPFTDAFFALCGCATGPVGL